MCYLPTRSPILACLANKNEVSKWYFSFWLYTFSARSSFIVVVFFQTCKINEYINASTVEITPVLSKGDRREQKYPSSSLGLCQDSLILELLDKGQHVKENMQWGFWEELGFGGRVSKMGIRNTKTHVSSDWYTLVCDTQT